MSIPVLVWCITDLGPTGQPTGVVAPADLAHPRPAATYTSKHGASFTVRSPFRTPTTITTTVETP